MIAHSQKNGIPTIIATVKINDIPTANVKSVFLVDPTMHGKVQENGNVQYVPGVYELSEKELDGYLKKQPIIPKLISSKYQKGKEQVSSRGYGVNSMQLMQLKRRKMQEQNPDPDSGDDR